MTGEADKAGKSGAIGLAVAVVTNEQAEALLDGVKALVSALTAISEQLRTSTLGPSAVAADPPEPPERQQQTEARPEWITVKEVTELFLSRRERSTTFAARG